MALNSNTNNGEIDNTTRDVEGAAEDTNGFVDIGLLNCEQNGIKLDVQMTDSEKAKCFASDSYKQHAGSDVINNSNQNISLKKLGPSQPETNSFAFTNDVASSTEKTDDELESTSPLSPVKYKEKLSSAAINSEDEIDQEAICGIGSFKPQWLQKFANGKSYLVLYSILCILQGTFYSSLTTSLTTLEKRYAFTSKISGLFMTMDEILPIIAAVFVGYFGGRSHRPRIIAIGSLMAAFSAFIVSLPYFLYGENKHLVSFSASNNTHTEYCDNLPKLENCDDGDRPPTLVAIICIMTGCCSKSFGGVCLYVIGVTYLDDCTKKKNTPLFLAITMALRLLGPVFGYVMSSAFLKFYENPLVDPGFGTDDPRWIGAWWLGFLIQSILLAIFSLPMFLFPRDLKPKRGRRASVANTNEESLKDVFIGLFKGIKKLSKNGFFLWLAVGTVLNILGSFGLHAMLPKYMESQFGLTASSASLFSGPPAIALSQICIILGGFVLYRWKPSARILIIGSGVAEFISVLLISALMIPSCQYLNMKGISSDDFKLENECNQNCKCTTSVFAPICDTQTQSTYFSPCFAGCFISTTSDGETIIGNCTCIQGTNNSFITVEVVKEGICQENNCWSQALIYIIILPVIGATTAIFGVPSVMLLLRSIDPKDKSMALGVYDTMCGLFAFLPSPIIFGALVDSVCRIWEQSCGETGNCWVYDVQSFRFLFHSVTAGGCFLSCCCYIGMYAHRKAVRNLYEEEDEEEQK